jgi:protein-S-isoprenylcysteine O-methyltransferase Ste14
MSTVDLPSLSRLDAYGRRRIRQVLLTLGIFTLVIFISAGRLDFVWGWVYFGLACLSLLLGAIYVLRHNPQAINERGRPAEGQKRWDKIIIAIYAPLSVSVYVVSGLDARFNWSAVSLWLHLLGVALTAVCSTLTYAAMAHNPFLSMYVQVAEARGHQVASSGPYRHIRHPMYLSLVLSWPALALLLGSVWALIPGLASLMIIIRTALDDHTLLRSCLVTPSMPARYATLPGLW